eukprot:1144634-Pelagomonas_calceolata.AAC.2
MPNLGIGKQSSMAAEGSLPEAECASRLASAQDLSMHMLAGEDQSQADQSNSLAEGLSFKSDLEGTRATTFRMPIFGPDQMDLCGESQGTHQLAHAWSAFGTFKIDQSHLATNRFAHIRKGANGSLDRQYSDSTICWFLKA